MKDEDEIEYFGVIPSLFTKELEEELVKSLKEVLVDINPKIALNLQNLLEKNMNIFSNFVQRNILRFPANFKLERKITDKVVNVDVQSLLDTISKLESEFLTYEKEYYLLAHNLEKEMHIKENYLSLLKNSDSFKNCVFGLKELNEFIDNFDINKMIINDGFEKLLEYKNIKNQFYKNERERLLKIASFDVFQHYLN